MVLTTYLEIHHMPNARKQIAVRRLNKIIGELEAWHHKFPEFDESGIIYSTVQDLINRVLVKIEH